MRILLQRASHGRVEVDGEVVGAIERGFVLLVGITHSDSEATADWLARKVAGIRLFDDDAGNMNLSLAEVGGSVLAISQFTLYGNARKGRRPSFIDAARPSQASPLFDYFITRLRSHDLVVATGIFGADMQVTLCNDGPVTLMLERE